MALLKAIAALLGLRLDSTGGPRLPEAGAADLPAPASGPPADRDSRSEGQVSGKLTTRVDTTRYRRVSVRELGRKAARAHKPGAYERCYDDSLDGVVVSEEYEAVRQLAEERRPVILVTGKAGSGKTTLIRYLRNTLNCRLAVTAFTGVAALNVGGTTLHSLFRLPPRIHTDEDIKRLYDRKLYQKLELLVIDEISMVRCDLLDSIDKFLRKNRSVDLPFGGVRLLLVGDLFQLPPVANDQEWDVLRRRHDSKHFFSSLSLQQTSLTSCELTSSYRHEDPEFVKLLNRIRVCEDVETAIAEINRRCFRQDGFVADITLTCTNDKADQLNARELRRLASAEHTFRGSIEGIFRIEKDKLPSPMDLRLKAGAHVMFTKNDPGRRWVNGTLGIVRELGEKSIRVELISDSTGMIHDVLPVTWEAYGYEYDEKSDQIKPRVTGRYTQYPLMLAWAVTIHKSQGKTLDKVMIDLGHGAFDSGQVYVALSRSRSLDGIRLSRPIRNSDVKCDPAIRRFCLALAEVQE